MGQPLLATKLVPLNWAGDWRRRLVGWPVGWPVGWRVGWPVGWLGAYDG